MQRFLFCLSSCNIGLHPVCHVISYIFSDFLKMQIEPESQTQLMNATMNMEGVLLAGVPAGGGFDAIFAVTLGYSSSNLTKTWSSLNVLAL